MNSDWKTSLRPCALAILAAVILPLGAWAEPPGLEGEQKAVWVADETLNRAVAYRDRELFESLIAEDAVFLGGGLVEGRQAIVVSWGIFFAVDRTTSISWKPNRVEVADSGDLAYTLGDFEIRSTSADGSQRKATGTYVSIWRKDANGDWKAVVDAGTATNTSLR